MESFEMKNVEDYKASMADNWSNILKHYKIVSSEIEKVVEYYRELYKRKMKQLKEGIVLTMTDEWTVKEVSEMMKTNFELYMEKFKKFIAKVKRNIDNIKVKIDKSQHKSVKDVVIFVKQANKYIGYLNAIINYLNNREFIIDDKVLSEDSFLLPMNMIKFTKKITESKDGGTITNIIISKKY
ncbi:putative Bracovirus protein MdBV-9-2 [Microplitis demolitor]